MDDSEEYIRKFSL